MISSILGAFKILKWGWKLILALIVGFVIWKAAVLVKNAVLGVWTDIAMANPIVKDLEAKVDTLQAENMVQYTKLKTFESEVLDYARTDSVLRHKIKHDSVNYVSLTAQKQNVIATLNAKIKTKDVLIANLETGIQVDLVKLIYKNALFGPDKLVDSLYLTGYRYGSLVEL